jgi:hypothetical protein
MPIQRMATAYGFFRNLGVGHGTALGCQWAVTAAVVLAAAWIWSRARVSIDMKCAALCAAIPLASPYAFYYEMVPTLVAGLFLVRTGFGATAAERLWLLVLWCGPVPALYLPSLTNVVTIAPLILAVTMASTLHRAWRANAAGSAGDAG